MRRNGVLGTRGPRSVLLFAKKSTASSPGSRQDPPGASRCALLTLLETYQSLQLNKNIAKGCLAPHKAGKRTGNQPLMKCNAMAKR
eukprot:4560969-Pyramimonas_sp.AAC.1